MDPGFQVLQSSFLACEVIADHHPSINQQLFDSPLRDVPSFGVYMVVYEWLLFHWPKSEDAKRRMVAAAIAGGCAGK